MSKDAFFKLTSLRIQNFRCFNDFMLAEFASAFAAEYLIHAERGISGYQFIFSTHSPLILSNLNQDNATKVIQLSNASGEYTAYGK